MKFRLTSLTLSSCGSRVLHSSHKEGYTTISCASTNSPTMNFRPDKSVRSVFFFTFVSSNSTRPMELNLDHLLYQVSRLEIRQGFRRGILRGSRWFIPESNKLNLRQVPQKLLKDKNVENILLFQRNGFERDCFHSRDTWPTRNLPSEVEQDLRSSLYHRCLRRPFVLLRPCPRQGQQLPWCRQENADNR